MILFVSQITDNAMHLLTRKRKLEMALGMAFILNLNIIVNLNVIVYHH